MLPRVARLCTFALAFFAVVLASTTVATAQAGKIPITTSSEAARQAYLDGRALLDKLRGQDARAHFERAVAEDPDFAVAHLQLAFTEPTFRGFFDQIDRAVALANGASTGEQIWIRGVKSGVDGHAMEQRAAYRDLVAAFPDDERAHTLLGNHFFGQQEYELAIASFEAAIRIAPEFSQPYNQLGYAYRFLKDYERAEKTFQKYIELIPEDPNPYDSYAELLLKTGRYEESIASYRQALGVDPHFIASHMGIACNLNYLGRYDEARRQLRLMYKGARTDGERQAALQTKAVSFADEGDLGAALEALSQQYDIAAANNDPGAMAAALGFTGDLLMDTGATAAARATYEKARDLVQISDLADQVKANNRRNYLYDATYVDIANGDLDAARAKAGRYAAEAREMQNGFFMRLGKELAGAIALAAGDGEAAVAALELSNLQDPYNIYRMACAYRLLGDAEQERSWLEQTVNFSALNFFNYAMVRHRAARELEAL